MGFDLVIRGATVVTPGHREAADIGIAGGRIAQLGGTMTGGEELAAAGLLAIPGGVDAHTHLAHQGLGDRLGFPIWVDDFWSGSRAAIAGGITTIGNMTYPVPDEEGTEETPSAAITREMAGAAAEAAVDWFLHPILLHPAALAEGEVAALAEHGHASIKMFLADPDLAADEPALLAAASAAKAAGSVTLLHCEDGAMLRQAGEKLIGEGRGAVANFPDARPVAAEVAAVDQAIGIARRTGARVYIVHLSSAAALDRCRRARAAGLPVYVETRPLYLHLTRERFAEPDAAKYVGAPPLREQSDREALWAGLAAGDVDTLCSDHAPWTLEAKLDPVLNVVTARQGVADLETLMPMLYSEGVLAGRISLDRFVALTSANAARIFGLYPRKGAIAAGSDADVTLWDPGHRRTIDGARMQSLSGYSVYDGWQVQGWPRFVLRRGQFVLADGEITARAGDGEWLQRNRTAGALHLTGAPRNAVPTGARPAVPLQAGYCAGRYDIHNTERAPRPGGPVASPAEPASIYDWAVPSNLQPEPITLEVWRNLPEDFCRQVELVNGQAVRCEKPSRAHQAAASRIAAMLDAAADTHMERNPGSCLDTSGDFDVLLWEIPATTIRSPDAALFDCAPNDRRPLPASLVRVVVEVVSPGSRKADKLDKMAEYADAGIPFYWLVWLSDEHVLQIDIHVLDHTLGYYRLYRTLNPEEEVSVVDVPVRIRVEWARLAHLVRS